MCKQSLKNLFVLTLCLTNTLKGILSGMKQSNYDHVDGNYNYIFGEHSFR